MADNYQTEQESFWAGEFGEKYVQRNRGDKLIASKTAMFAEIFFRVCGVKSVLELGANIGLNLRAINYLMPNVKIAAVEINPVAAEELEQWGRAQVYRGSIFDFVPEEKADFVFTSGVLIHINPENLSAVYECLYESTNKYICVSEYYNPTPVSITYRGEEEKLFKRDFAGEILDRYKDVRLVDYGFVYHRDPNFPQDDTTWFLLEKQS